MSAAFRVMVLAGDGVGPEIVAAAQRVLAAAGERFGFTLAYEQGLLGGAAIDALGRHTEAGLYERCRACDAVLLGAVGGPRWETTDPDKPRPEQGLLGLRKGLELFANLRPVKSFAALSANSTIKAETIAGVDLVVVRELTGGVYFGKRERVGDSAYDTMLYTAAECDRLLDYAFGLAARRCGLVHSVDKANVLETTEFWKEIVIEVGREYPQVELSHMYVDNAAMQLVRNPKQFDVMVTGNIFGDILSDEASMLTGSIGMLPSASLDADNKGLYEPSHGSAPDIAGRDLANPLATILSVAMMLRYTFNLEEAATRVEDAVKAVLAQGLRTGDIFEPGCTRVGCAGMGDAVVAAM